MANRLMTEKPQEFLSVPSKNGNPSSLIAMTRKARAAAGTTQDCAKEC
jgi:hypothetical protein